MHGVTFADSLADASAPERHTQQYFETIGNRAMYKDGWWLAVRTQRIPWVLTPEVLKDFAPGVWNPDADPAAPGAGLRGLALLNLSMPVSISGFLKALASRC
jgi:arylsulfatase A-like enzyme